jgi:hypothetical protein
VRGNVAENEPPRGDEADQEHAEYLGRTAGVQDVAEAPERTRHVELEELHPANPAEDPREVLLLEPQVRVYPLREPVQRRTRIEHSAGQQDHGVEGDRRQDQCRRGEQQRAVPEAADRDQQEAEQRIEYQDVPGPDEAEVHHADAEQHPEPSAEPRREVDSLFSGAQHLHGEPDPEEQREERAELPFRQHGGQEVHRGIRSRGGQRGLVLGGDVPPFGEPEQVHDEDPQQGDAA